MTTKSLINLAQAMQAIALVSENVKETKKKKKNLLKLGMKNIVGIELIKTTGQLASSL